MTQKNDITALIGAFLVTATLVGVGFWWLTQKLRVNLINLQPTNTSPNSNKQTGSQFTQTGYNLFSEVQNVPSGVFNYGGSTSWAPIRLVADSELQAARPEFRLRYVEPVGSAPGSGTGIRMLIRDQLAFAQSSRPILDSEFQQAEQRGYKLKQVPVAIDGLAVAVNLSLNIPGLTLDQLRAIYTSQVTNWQEVGGPNLLIKPFTRPVTAGGTVELFVEDVLRGSPFGKTVRTVSTTTDALRELAKSPGGIYFASATEVVPQCTVKPLPMGRRPGEWVPPYQEPLIAPAQCPSQRNQLNLVGFQSGQYPLTRNLYVVIKQNGRVEEQAGEAYANLLLTGQGQEAIAKAGFVKVR
ncbi:PstS family phosphate ABC transporter substrate-binding protein [Leptothermofonsia sp. ETS-13]|uniref:PstS family phosphate ABC transporter substrate-binding protein n=1 Tax=Leptothermofonsia sp. ETS-13 TaxID=3035696 RepID=UPI003BA0D393